MENEIIEAEMPVTLPPGIAAPGTVREWWKKEWVSRTKSMMASLGRKMPNGPWLNEPDKMQWVDLETGLPCLIVRSPTTGALCGYAGVYPGHVLHGVDYAGCPIWCEESQNDPYPHCSHSPESILQVHGGITFSDGCAHGDDESSGICHIPEPGTSDDVHWFGFDCAHCFDLSPGLSPMFKGDNREYRDIVYVAKQVHRLASQLSRITPATLSAALVAGDAEAIVNQKLLPASTV